MLENIQKDNWSFLYIENLIEDMNLPRPTAMILFPSPVFFFKIFFSYLPLFNLWVSSLGCRLIGEKWKLPSTYY